MRLTYKDLVVLYAIQQYNSKENQRVLEMDYPKEIRDSAFVPCTVTPLLKEINDIIDSNEDIKNKFKTPRNPDRYEVKLYEITRSTEALSQAGLIFIFDEVSVGGKRYIGTIKGRKMLSDLREQHGSVEDWPVEIEL